MNKYIGHPCQLSGIEEMYLSGGKASGMRMLYVRNGKGLEFWISVDRCADIGRLSLKGDNLSYFAPCGYVSPKFYDNKGSGFLSSFTAGFLTTCGLTAVGTPCTDNGEELPLHGTIANTPSESISYSEYDGALHIKAVIRDAAVFSHKLLLEREYTVALDKNEILLKDTIKNIGSDECPLEVLYHCNIGYPLLSEKSVLSIPSTEVIPRNEHSRTGIDSHSIIEKPQSGYEEMCYYHTFSGETEVSIYNPEIQKGLIISYDASNLKCFNEWKMMGEYDYVLGLEPGNCTPDGRNVMREKGLLETLEPGKTRVFEIKFTFTEEK